MKDNRPKKTTTVSIYHDQTETFKQLGGSKWLRTTLDFYNSNRIKEKLQLSDIAIDAIKRLRDIM